MKYRSLEGYKYELLATVAAETGIYGATAREIVSHSRKPLVCLWATGRIFVFEHYAWDGPSGPTFDTKTFMRGSLIHDALYQLMREGSLDRKHRKQADEILREICLADGMNRFRAWYVYQCVRIFSKKSALPRKKPRGKVYEI